MLDDSKDFINGSICHMSHEKNKNKNKKIADWVQQNLLEKLLVVFLRKEELDMAAAIT